ncbi:hotdog fold domain-containing protein [Megasphaera vaginalis (ex Bordigoni et al. 2020)]|uniref:hotdog fold domain-containing protein n=2 Tax=Megasphaera TaxID=906 RepID=UPI002E1FC93C
MTTACMAALSVRFLAKSWGTYVFKKTGMPAYTADLHIRFREAVPIGEEIRVVGRLKSQRNRLYLMEGIVYKATGAVAATAEAKLMAEK